MNHSEIETQNTETPDLLGTGDIDPAVAEGYRERRRIAGMNIAGELSAHDEEYKRRQSEVNATYVEDLGQAFPKVNFDYRTRSYSPVSLNKINGLKVTGLEASLVFDTSRRSMDSLDGEMLADISALRASIIWIESDIEDQIDVKLEGSTTEYDDTSVPGRLSLPYILIGHKSKSDDRTEVLLMPLSPKTGRASYWDRHEGEKPIVASIPVQREAMYTDHLNLNWNNQLLQAELSDEQYDKLIAIQETLFDLGLKPDDVKELHDEASGSLVLSEDSIPAVKATLANGIHRVARHRVPNSVRDLSEHAFSLDHPRFRSTKLSPVEFLDFSVINDTQRAASMLNLFEAFGSAQDKLVRTSYKDPNGQWLDHAVELDIS